MTRRLLALIAAVTLVGCDKTREIVHEMTRPEAAAPAATPPVAAAAAADAAPAPPASASASASAVRDAGKPPVKVTASATPKPKTKQPPLNGLPAGAVCVQGPEGNGGCASGSACESGRCTCYNGWTSCGGACRDLSRDPYNCDACGHECNYGEYCRWGHCER